MRADIAELAMSAVDVWAASVLGAAGSSFGDEMGRRWEIAPAWYGSGSWLIALAPGNRQAWAPPGVALTGEDDEPAERWTFGWWPATASDLHPCRPARTATCTVGEVLAEVPAHYGKWVVDCTRRQIELLELYTSTAPDADDQHAAEAHTSRTLLLAELDAMPKRRLELRAEEPAPSHLPACADALDRACRALSDFDFAGFVSRVLRAELKLDFQRARSALGCDLLVAERDGHRHFVEVNHDVRVTARDCAARPPVPGGLCEHDVYWRVSSDVVGDGAHRAAHGRAPERVLGAPQLAALLEAHPTVADTEFKLKIAYAAVAPSDPPTGFIQDRARLPVIAETAALEEARARLRSERALVVAGAPGMGKTTLAELLLSEAALDGFTVAPVRSTDEVPRHRRGSESLALLFEDVASLDEVRDWLFSAAHSDDLRVVVTTERVAEDEPLRKWCMHLDGYSTSDRARIVYNHLWPKLVEDPWLAARGWVAACRALVDHPRFSPRLAADFANSARILAGSPPGPPDDPPRAYDEEGEAVLERLANGWHECAECARD